MEAGRMDASQPSNTLYKKWEGLEVNIFRKPVYLWCLKHSSCRQSKLRETCDFFQTVPKPREKAFATPTSLTRHLISPDGSRVTAAPAPDSKIPPFRSTLIWPLRSRRLNYVTAGQHLQPPMADCPSPSPRNVLLHTPNVETPFLGV